MSLLREAGRIVVFGLVLCACGEAAGPAADTWDLEVQVDKLIVLGSCDGPAFPFEDLGTGAPGEFVFQFTLSVDGGPAQIIAGTPLYPERSGQLSLAQLERYSGFEPVTFSVTVPPGEVATLTFTWMADELDTVTPTDPRLAVGPFVDVWSSREGFSAGQHAYAMGSDGCRLQADVLVAATQRGAAS